MRLTNAQVELHRGLVESIAWGLASKMPTLSEREDLIQSGFIGLISSASSFDETKGAQFNSHAYSHIRGAMLDMLRDIDPLYRSDRQTLKKLERFVSRHEAKHGRKPLASERALAIGKSLEWLLEFEANLGSFEYGFMYAEKAPEQYEPDVRAIEHERWRKFFEAAECLDERSKEAVDAVLIRGERPMDVAARFGVSPSRISQIVRAAALHIQQNLKSR